MAEFSAFSLDFGTSQGRIQPANWTAQGGDYVFCLGSDLEDVWAKLEMGDWVEINQSVDLTGVNFIRARFRLRNPESMPSNRSWQASIRVGMAGYASTYARAGKTRDLTDLAANVSKLSGSHTVAFRLAYVGV